VTRTKKPGKTVTNLARETVAKRLRFTRTVKSAPKLGTVRQAAIKKAVASVKCKRTAAKR
jgi:hypothetical protein